MASGGLQPPKTHLDTYSDPARVAKKGFRLGRFLLPPQPNPFSHSPNPSSSRPGIPTAGTTRCPQRVWESRGEVGRVCPLQLHPGVAANLAQPGPNALAGGRDTMSPWRPHRDTATARETRGKGLARGRGGRWHRTAPGAAAIRKNLEALARPAEAPCCLGKAARREGSPRQAGKHAGIFVLSSPGEAVPEPRQRAEPEPRLGRRG